MQWVLEIWISKVQCTDQSLTNIDTSLTFWTSVFSSIQWGNSMKLFQSLLAVKKCQWLRYTILRVKLINSKLDIRIYYITAHLWFNKNLLEIQNGRFKQARQKFKCILKCSLKRCYWNAPTDIKSGPSTK